jgi:hypothetical protein
MLFVDWLKCRQSWCYEGLSETIFVFATLGTQMAFKQDGA